LISDIVDFEVAFNVFRQLHDGWLMPDFDQLDVQLQAGQSLALASHHAINSHDMF
jgi:hypothetical protein